MGAFRWLDLILPALEFLEEETYCSFFQPDISHIAVNGGVIILSFFASAQILGLYWDGRGVLAWFEDCGLF